MRILIVGCGLVGTELARSLRADGHHVIGTTTTPAKVARLSEVCDEVAVLSGADRAAVHAAAEGADAVVVTAGPSAAQAMTVEQRQRTYRQVLVDTAESVASIPGRPHLVMLSSLSVYGDAANHLDLIDEDAPLTTSSDPSPAMFQEAERTYRAAAADRLTVFRCADITGGEDPPIADKVRMAHQVLGGSVPFHDEALFYRVHMLDVVRAVKHALDHDVVGTFNLTHAEVPPRMAPYFDALSAIDGLPPLTYRNELRAPTVPVSVDRLLATGFVFEHTEVESMPAEDAAPAPREVPEVDRSGRELVTAVLERVVRELGVVEQTGADGDAALPLHAVGGPLDGTRIGAVRIFTREDGLQLVHSVLAIDEFGMDTHQLYAFTPAGSALPHLFLDTAISPNTGGTFHFGLDLAPRVDLGASLDYLDAVYTPLTEPRAAALAQPGILPVPSIGPLQWALRSPWMIAAIAAPTDLKALAPITDEYVDRWLGLVRDGLPAEVEQGVAWQDVARRDQLARAAMFSARTNPVWTLLDRLLGPDTAAALRATLTG
ncbi:MAG: NAD-dependent epimerase/dehydratase family protein [Candidatus Nanopelagicales bacterium]